MKALLIAHLPLLLTGLATLISAVLLPKVNRWAKAVADKATTGSIASKEFTFLAALSTVVAGAVQQVESQERPEVTDITADGSITAEEGERLKRAAVEIAKAQAKLLFPQVLGLFDDIFLDDKIGHLVETYAARLAGDSRVHLERTDPKKPTAA